MRVVTAESRYMYDKRNGEKRPPLYTLVQILEPLGYHVNVASRLAQTHPGTMPEPKLLVGSQKYYVKADVLAWLERFGYTGNTP